MKTEKVLWRKKYITVLILSLLILAAVLYGIRNGRRNDKGGNILAGASPDTSAFQMYYFDGETVAVRTLYDSGAEKEVIKKINGIPLQAAEEDAPSQMEPPFYGFWVSSQDGFDISVAASGGVWLKNDGAVYYGDTDLSGLWEQMEGKDEDTWNALNFPNAGRLSAYHTIFLLKADEQTAEVPEGLTLTVEDIGTSEITVRITNNSGEEFSYGEYFSIQKQIDGQWYTVPVRADNVGFQDIAHILPNGESASETYNLNIYGTLEPGTYRLVVETLSAEFLVGHGRMAGIEGE
ncbi:hypothetical protein NSB25_01915 [Acetatifactor muris]|uniref:immunoglobulin-like domain-containing protein n=1 Tax=Acetatifactor muris TaxID=879566 RepID=UPI000CD2F95A|nr:immunoglobulin-like domain-containing protein [Acetatifactor muris]MCR2046035.1 hypothetical protein [Acetatifactor muris]